MSQIMACPKCGKDNTSARYFCKECGALLDRSAFPDGSVYEDAELRVMRIVENLKHTPHSSVLWNDTVDMYTKKVERYRAIMNLPEMKNDGDIGEKMQNFLELCTKPEFQIAFVGTIKTGKSTLINALLGHNYASMAVTPETAALTKFRSSPKDYVRVIFYSRKEWRQLWASRTSGADAFIREYNELNADSVKDQWVGHEPVYKEIANSDVEQELAIWSSSKHAEHYFVKEIEAGISSLPEDFPKQVVFVDTPGLCDPVAYRSEITKQYIRKANAVFVCVDAQKVQKDEIETISSVFSFSSHNKNKVRIIATHWDKLNKPDEDWAEQKEWLLKRLTGKGFFDTAEMADKNIMHSAAYIYNLCRDFEELSPEDRTPLMQLALAMKMSDLSKLKEYIPNMKAKTNIEHILQIVTDELAGNYRLLLCQDIEKKYLDIMYTLRRIAKEDQKETREILEMTTADIEKMKAKVEEQKKNYEEIMACRQQLTAILKTVETNTQKRLEAMLARLKPSSKSGKQK